MSWSVNVEPGAKDEVRAESERQFASEWCRIAEYDENDESDDITLARASVRTALLSVQPNEGEGVYVKAYGTHTVVDGKMRGAGFRVAVSVAKLPEKTP